MKRGQVTIFIIVGIVILAAGIIFLSLRPVIDEPEVKDTSSLKNYVQVCLEKSSDKAIVEVARRGGSLIKQKEANFAVTYWSLVNKPSIPTLDHSAAAISQETIKELNNCVKDFEPFLESGMKIESLGDPHITSTIRDEDIFVTLAYPINFRIGNEVISLESFQASIPSDYGKLYGIGKEFIVDNLETPEGFCLSCVSVLSAKYKIPITYEQYGDDFIISIIGDVVLSLAVGYSKEPQVLEALEYYYDFPVFTELPPEFQNLIKEIGEAEGELE